MLASVFALSMVPVILLMTAEPARACSCGIPPPPCEAVGQSALVFLGTVVAADAERPLKHARMRIDRKFKGALPSEVELYDDGMCDGPNLQIGRQYLMYTSGLPSESLPARGCTRSRAVEYADEDLHFLDTYVHGKTATEISGTVRFSPDEADDTSLDTEGGTPMKDVRVTIVSEGREYGATTDASGRYSISRIPAGTYEIRAELAGYGTNWTVDQIALAPRGCAVADVLMKVDRRVQGITRSGDGRPLAGVLVELVPTSPNPKRWLNPILIGESDEHGAYVIDGIPPGEYFLGINIRRTPTKENPYPATYYPNTHDAKDAISVAFMVGPGVRSLDLTAPARIPIISVRGRITDADGLPPENRPEIRIQEPGLYGQIQSQPLDVDSQGRFEIQLCEGVRYSGFAFAGPPLKGIYSVPVEFTASGGDSELVFVLNKSSKEFRELSRKLR